MESIADETMVRNALGEAYDALAEPPGVHAPSDHTLWPSIRRAICGVYDPEIPVNVYELGLIYAVSVTDLGDGQADVAVKMTLTSPACPVAQDMPGMVQSAIFPVEGVRAVDVEIVWDPPWNPGMMAETAKLQLNMFV